MADPPGGNDERRSGAADLVGDAAAEIRQEADLPVHPGQSTRSGGEARPARPRGRAPTTSGRTSAGIALHEPRVSSSVTKPALPMWSRSGRLHRHPSAKLRQGRSSRSCQRASRAEVARTCSMKRNRPRDGGRGRSRQAPVRDPRPCRERGSRRPCRPSRSRTGAAPPVRTRPRLRRRGRAARRRSRLLIARFGSVSTSRSRLSG